MDGWKPAVLFQGEDELQESPGMSNQLFILYDYQENGYMNNEFYPTPIKDSDRHEISYKLDIREHSRSHVENIIIKGNSKTKEYVITREIPIESGDIYSRDKIINGLRNLMNLRYFSNVVPEPQPGSEEKRVSILNMSLSQKH